MVKETRAKAGSYMPTAELSFISEGENTAAHVGAADKHKVSFTRKRRIQVGARAELLLTRCG